ncbi:MAG: alpha-glucan family phosphorylase [Candidatus Electryoneaceae bacterium]|nr:alpha-glucan family phosphorylase [Candidatus Electryoneaceae bacterium]
MKVKPFNVVPNLPEEIQDMRDIAMNLWASWNWSASQLFIRLDPETWEKCKQNLPKILGQIPQEILEKAAKDDSFTANLDRVSLALQVYLQMKTWFSEEKDGGKDLQVAYFSMEFGLDVGLPIYSGGLGILAGDHMKSSSDLGIPLVGVGLLYQQGYFQQYLNSDGWQMERYENNDWYSMPVTRQTDDNGNPLKITVDVAGETLSAHIWKVIVGRIGLYLLDTNIAENPPHLRQVTAQLYGGDRENRIRQEILLGVGGIRALEALGIKPTVYHMNEGHSAFSSLERLRNLMSEQGLSLAQARESVWASTVFTTHTPVIAGNEYFGLDLIGRYFSNFAESLGLSWEQFLKLGQEPGNEGVFSMTVLALKMAAHCNGVSELHGKVSRKMWKKLWPGLSEQEIPIGHITNGIHTRTWLSSDLDTLMQSYIGPQFIEEPHDQKLWERINKIPDLELWRVHQIRKERLIFFARKRLKRQLFARGAGVAEIKSAEEILNSRALTIGFARRFATYKRANLILADEERLRQILTDPERPVQFIFAGKAHPQDNYGKEYIRRLIHFASDPAIRPHFVFLEDYDINVAKYLVQGVDIWLSTPKRPLEASGTSGMKAVANGAINVSTLDGWWAEAYDPSVGWAIGSGETNGNSDELDRIESEALYNLLEQEIIPGYFDRDRAGIPREWIALMKRSMDKLGGYFNTHRMVMQYCENYYLNAHRAGAMMMEDNAKKAQDLAGWRGWVSERWQAVTIESEDTVDIEIKAGNELPISVKVGLNGLNPSDVAVEMLYGPIDPESNVIEQKILRLNYHCESDGVAIFVGNVPCVTGGRQGYAVRIRPDHPELVHSLTPLLMTWE